MAISYEQGAVDKLGLVFRKIISRRMNKQSLSIWSEVEDLNASKNLVLDGILHHPRMRKPTNRLLEIAARNQFQNEMNLYYLLYYDHHIIISHL